MSLALAVPLSLDACHKKSSSDLGTFRMPITGEPPNLDPQLADTGLSILVLDQISSTLFDYDSEQRIRPYDAKGYTWQKDGHELLVDVRTDLKWSDGLKVTACQYRDGILRALDPQTPSAMADLLFDIGHAADRKAGKVNESEVRITCDDTHAKIVFGVTRPFAWPLLHALAFAVSAPVRKEEIQARAQDWMLPKPGATVGLSTGAFTVKEWSHDRRIILEARQLHETNLPDDRRAGVDTVELPIVKDPATAFTLYVNDEIDVLPELPLAMTAKLRDRPDRVSSPYFTTYMIGFSLKANPALKDKRVRQALALAANQEEIPQLLGGGEEPARGWVPPGLLSPLIRPKTSSFDPERALKLLQEAGYKNKKFPTLKLYFNAGDRHQLIMERIANNWKTYLGIKVELEPMEWKVLVAKLKNRAPDMYRYAWAAVYPDPLFFLELFVTGGANNFGGWSNSTYDMIVRQLVGLPLDRRDDSFWKQIDEAQKILISEDPALIPIYHYVRNTLVNPAVKGLDFNWHGTGYLRAVRKIKL